MIPVGEPLPTEGRIVRFTHDEYTAARAGGNVHAGTTCPAIIVKVWDATGGYVNLKVINDSEVDTWETSVFYGLGGRQWYWPAIIHAPSIPLNIPIRVVPAEEAII